MGKSSPPNNVLAVTERTAADLLGVSESTLRRWRRFGNGPHATKISRLVRYQMTDLRRFLRAAGSKPRG